VHVLSLKHHSFHADSAWGALIEFPAISTKSDLDEASTRCIIHLQGGRVKDQTSPSWWRPSWRRGDRSPVSGFPPSVYRPPTSIRKRAIPELQNRVVRGCRICQPGIVRTCGAYEWRSPSNSWAPLQPRMLFVLLKVSTKECICEIAMIYAWHMTDTLKIITNRCFGSSRFRNSIQTVTLISRRFIIAEAAVAAF